jgi:hypothetical protein
MAGWSICYMSPAAREFRRIAIPFALIQRQTAAMKFPFSPFLSGLARAAAICAPSFAADYFPPPDSDGGWRALKTAQEIRQKAGMDLSTLDAAYTVTERSTGNGGLLVLRHGYLVYEKYFGRASRNCNPDMASTGKAFTSIACGVMLHEFHDKIPQGLDTKVFTEKYLPEAFPWTIRERRRSRSASCSA